MERCGLKLTILEMTDCKHFRYNEIKKRQAADNIKLLQISHCLIGIGGIYGCPKYCPLYEPNQKCILIK